MDPVRDLLHAVADPAAADLLPRGLRPLEVLDVAGDDHGQGLREEAASRRGVARVGRAGLRQALGVELRGHPGPVAIERGALVRQRARHRGVGLAVERLAEGRHGLGHLDGLGKRALVERLAQRAFAQRLDVEGLDPLHGKLVRIAHDVVVLVPERHPRGRVLQRVTSHPDRPHHPVAPLGARRVVERRDVPRRVPARELGQVVHPLPERGGGGLELPGVRPVRLGRGLLGPRREEAVLVGIDVVVLEDPGDVRVGGGLHVPERGEPGHALVLGQTDRVLDVLEALARGDDVGVGLEADAIELRAQLGQLRVEHGRSGGVREDRPLPVQLQQLGPDLLALLVAPGDRWGSGPPCQAERSRDRVRGRNRSETEASAKDGSSRTRRARRMTPRSAPPATRRIPPETPPATTRALVTPSVPGP